MGAVPSNTSAQGPNHLASLPTELRPMIYERALPSRQRSQRCTESADISKHLSLLFVDRTTHTESLPVFISSNSFTLSAAAFMVCADMSIFKHIEHLVIPCLEDLRIKARAVKFEDGENSDLGEELLKLLASMPVCAEQLRQYSTVHDFFELKNRLHATNLGKTRHLVCKAPGVYFLESKQHTASYAQIMFSIRHFNYMSSDFERLEIRTKTVDDLIKTHGQIMLDRIGDWTEELYKAVHAPYRIEIVLLPIMARDWIQVGRAGCDVEDSQDQAFRIAYRDAYQDWLYRGDPKATTVWETVAR